MRRIEWMRGEKEAWLDGEGEGDKCLFLSFCLFSWNSLPQKPACLLLFSSSCHAFPPSFLKVLKKDNKDETNFLSFSLGQLCCEFQERKKDFNPEKI